MVCVMHHANAIVKWPLYFIHVMRMLSDLGETTGSKRVQDEGRHKRLLTAAVSLHHS